MAPKFEAFKQQIDEALDLIDNTHQIIGDLEKPLPLSDQLVDINSLLARCERAVEKHRNHKPIIRIIHHLACSGGTLVSKCISAMPNVFLLSEIYPHNRLGLDLENPIFAPTDITSLIKYANIPEQEKLAEKIFKESIRNVVEHVSNLGGSLVLRDHTHSDFCTNQRIPDKSSVIQLLEDNYEIRSALTIRNPIDSYASLIRNGWVHFYPQSFDEYCFRVNTLLNQFSEDRIFRYEDFVQTPASEMKKISNALAITYNENFENIFSAFKLSGDSGRSADHIAEKQRQTDHGLAEQIETSDQFRILQQTGLY